MIITPIDFADELHPASALSQKNCTIRFAITDNCYKNFFSTLIGGGEYADANLISSPHCMICTK